jgi:hypothetical protein
MRFFKLLLIVAVGALLFSPRLDAQSAWTLTRTHVPGVERANAIAFGNGRFVAAVNGRASERTGAVWSTDGLTWRASSLPASLGLGIVFTRGAFFMATVFAGVWRSTDGETWQQVFAPTQDAPNFGLIATDGRSLFVTNWSNNASTHFYSPDGVIWRETAPLPNSFNGFFYSLGYVAGHYVLLGSGRDSAGFQNSYAVSTVDGTRWSPVPDLGSANALVGGNDRVVALELSVQNPATLTSTDGISFTRMPILRATAGPDNIMGVRMGFAGGRYFLLGTLDASSDGLTWAPLATVTPAQIRFLYGIAYGNGRYVAVGYTDNLPTGPDIVAVLATTRVPPVITTGPADRLLIEGGRVAFSVVLENPSIATTFQWRRNGSAIPGATASAYVIELAQLADSARFTVEVRNEFGITTSDAATLTVTPAAQAGRIVNLSVLTSLDRSGETMLVGFVVGGHATSGPKSLLIRAGGPSLARFGVGNPNVDPRLELISAGAATVENDNWGGSPQLLSAFAQVGAYAYPSPDSKDAALLADRFFPSDSTVRISANNGATGAVIAELYDATPAGAFTVGTPRLINVSCLKTINAGATLKAGFVIGGATPRTILIRAIGPGLSRFGVANVLPNPALALFQGSMAAPIASNAGWGGSVELRAANATAGAFALDPVSRDAVLLVNLSPGNYTAEISGVNNTTGVALVEVYELP